MTAFNPFIALTSLGFDPSLTLFIGSLLFLVGGVALKIWTDAVNLGALDRRPLNWIEMTHPHIPSVRELVTLNLCLLALLGVGLLALRRVYPFMDPYQGLNLASLFIIAGTIGSLGELQWKGIRTYAHAFSLGTALAFLALTVFYASPLHSVQERVLGGIISIIIAAIAGNALEKGKRNRTKSTLVTVCVFLFWFLAYTLQ